MKTIVARPFSVTLERKKKGKSYSTNVLLDVFCDQHKYQLKLGELSQSDIHCLIMDGEQKFRIGKTILFYSKNLIFS